MGREQAGAVARPLDDALGTSARPTWRGRLHLVALVFAVPLVTGLAIQSDGGRARAGVIIYAVGLCSTLAVSTTYHRWVHTVRARARWRRLDHATIFALIAGTCSALALTTLNAGRAVAVLIAIWFAASVGAVLKLSHFERASRLGPVVYIAMGWSGVALAPAIWQRGGTLAFVCFVAGGLVYTVGAIGFARRWPTLRPATFSYHEVWHAFTIAAAGLHFATITTLST
ncbi:channel protein (hemolysin III family) [Ilumatobacter fluminis]|uniref:Channel protein (Hemolysin III family) n=1 Tax=Ilumatobacter fluminis TaxID=467091 RepID=A0A4R7I3X9_9ACTN|nr:hemolysin III family protein [Ilumatobacter fluminis]TDT17960.1 channel protein (hemolysin III family) [Ilumatobacter fluminis]